MVLWARLRSITPQINMKRITKKDVALAYEGTELRSMSHSWFQESDGCKFACPLGALIVHDYGWTRYIPDTTSASPYDTKRVADILELNEDYVRGFVCATDGEDYMALGHGITGDNDEEIYRFGFQDGTKIAKEYGFY